MYAGRSRDNVRPSAGPLHSFLPPGQIGGSLPLVRWWLVAGGLEIEGVFDQPNEGASIGPYRRISGRELVQAKLLRANSSRHCRSPCGDFGDFRDLNESS